MPICLSIRCFFVLIIGLSADQLMAQTIIELNSGVQASCRGIDVVSENEVWVSGSDGTVIRSVDSGETWTKVMVPDASELDFRDIEVLPDGSIILMSIGNGKLSKLFRSIDEGKTWNVVLQNQDEEAFFDGLVFHADGKRGALFGDPIDGVMDLYLTDDAGSSWKRLPMSLRPALMEGEYGFAASGTGMTWTNSGLQIATGGSVARIHRTQNQGRSWHVLGTPLLAGRQSAGIFSIAMRKDRIVIVGGDYLKPDEVGSNVATSNNAGLKFQIPAGNQIGHKACVRFLSDSTIIACGRTGIELSRDSGQTWKHISDSAYYTMNVAPESGLVFLAGPNGQVARLQVP